MIFSVEIRPIISQEVEADTWKEACDKIRETFEEQPWELEDIADSEMHDVTPPDPNTREQKLLKRLEGLIEETEAWKTPDSTDIKDVRFKDEGEYIEEDDPKDDWIPRYVYADIHVYAGDCGHTIEMGVEYDVEKLLEFEKKQAKEKEVKKDELE